MGKKKLKQDIDKLKHPNSRKTIALTKQLKKQSNREKSKVGQAIKQNLVAEKISWFKDRLSDADKCLDAGQVETLINLYLSRFDEELEQIRLKHSIGQRKNRQHASREDIINMTIKRETEEFNTAGLEIPDLMSAENVEKVKAWNGELRFLQNLKCRRFSRKFLTEQKEKNKMDT